MDIFRHTGMNYFPKDLVMRMNNTNPLASRKSEEYWRENFYFKDAEVYDKDTMRNKKEIVLAIMADKAAIRLASDRKKLSNRRPPIINEVIKSSVENTRWQTKAQLFSNFKSLHEGIQNGTEYQIPSAEIESKVRQKLADNHANLTENIRKKFLQESIDLLFKLVREIKEIQKQQAIKRAKCDMIRGAINDRQTLLDREEKRVNYLKEQGILSVKMTTLDNLPILETIAQAISKMSKLKNEVDGETTNRGSSQKFSYFKEDIPADPEEESMKVITSHLLVQKRVHHEIEGLKADVEDISAKVRLLNNEHAV